ncbi:MAG: DsrE/DsrF/TusD sulfur relay family protein [Candidatus Sericytochromatia bacterium]
MTMTLFILNDPPYGNERSYNALRLAGSLARKEGQQVRVFLMADAVLCAKAGQKVPNGYYNLELMLKSVLRHGGEVALCGTCMDARGLQESEIIEQTRRSTLEELTEWTIQADKTLNF